MVPVVSLYILVFFSLGFWKKEYAVFLLSVPTFAWVFFVHFRLKRIRCPICNRPLDPFDKHKDFFDLLDRNMVWNFRKALIPEKECRTCGYDLRGRNSEEE